MAHNYNFPTTLGYIEPRECHCLSLLLQQAVGRLPLCAEKLTSLHGLSVCV